MTRLLAKLPLHRTNPSTPTTSKPAQIPSPRPLPPRRKRKLTLPLPPSPASTLPFPFPRSKKQQNTSPQPHCLFLQKLPYDIRRIIYDEVLCGNIFHIIRMRRRLRHLRCSSEEGEARDLRKTCWGILRVDGRSIREFYDDRMGGRGRRTDGDVLPLLRSCRIIYTETIPLLYTSNTFDLNGLESALLLSTTLLPHRLNAITSLRLTWAFFQSFITSAPFASPSTSLVTTLPTRTPSLATTTTASPSPPNLPPPHRKALFPGDEATWKASWAVIAGMQSLRDVRIWLAMSPATEMSMACERELLSPLREVGPKRVFKVRVSWTVWDGRQAEEVEGKEKGGWEEEEVNYEIIRQVDQDWGAGGLRLQRR